jgi:hypothetical protein
MDVGRVSGKENSVVTIAVDHAHVRTPKGHPCRFAQADSAMAGPRIDESLKYFERSVALLTRRN